MEMESVDIDRIINLLNKIKILEFKYNCLLSEYGRIINYPKIREDELFKKWKLEVENILEPYTKDLTVKVSEMGIITILKEESKTDTAITYKKILDIFPTLKLPYAWEMGRKCGKRVSEQILKEYDYLLK